MTRRERVFPWAREPAPTCRCCGQKLRAFRRSTLYEDDKGPPPGAVNVIRVTRENLTLGEKREWYTYQLPGEWGDYGDGFFCGRSCGYVYGVARAKSTSDKVSGS